MKNIRFNRTQRMQYEYTNKISTELFRIVNHYKLFVMRTIVNIIILN